MLYGFGRGSVNAIDQPDMWGSAEVIYTMEQSDRDRQDRAGAAGRGSGLEKEVESVRCNTAQAHPSTSAAAEPGLARSSSSTHSTEICLGRDYPMGPCFTDGYVKHCGRPLRCSDSGKSFSLGSTQSGLDTLRSPHIYRGQGTWDQHGPRRKLITSKQVKKKHL